MSVLAVVGRIMPKLMPVEPFMPILMPMTGILPW